ncbi:MAG: histidine phosphatase family protein [Eubacteriales bacterium]|nr:histidine phosphatase family protein [Eubacteriales bacterium]
MRIYILRHGETAWNKARLLQGRSDIELNEKGIQLAQETAEGMKDISFDIIFTSPLKRAKETARLVTGKRDIPMVEDDRIMEISFGEFEGKPWRKTEDFPGDENIYNFFNHPEQYVPVKGGESLQELAQRTADFMKDICTRDELQDKTVLVSTHGAATRGLLNSLRQWDLSDFWHGRVAPNCGVAIIDVKDGNPVLVEENKTYYTTKVEPVKFN